MRRILVLLLFILAGALTAAAETRVGTVTSVIGPVSIDAFGKGAFIAAVKGDPLYSSTIIRTGPNGRAVLDLQGQAQEVPPGATVKVADLAAAGTRKGGLSWFAAVGRLVRSFAGAAQDKSGELVLGSRAANASEDTGMDWELEETDPAVLLPEARKSIEGGSYAAALETLGKADTTGSDPGLAWQVSFWKGFCYFQEEDYPDAVAHLSAAYGQTGSGAASAAPADREMLLFQLGSSLYLVGREKDAAPVLSAYLREFPDGQFAGYAKDLIGALPR